MTTIDPRARITDPETSHAAAAAATSSAGDCRANVLAILLQHPDGLTHEELIEEYRARRYPAHTDSGIRTRCRELYATGQVVRGDVYRKTNTGRQSIVWHARAVTHERTMHVVEVPERRHVVLTPTAQGERVEVAWTFRGAHAGELLGYVFPWQGRAAKWAYRTTRGRQGVATSFDGALRQLVAKVYGQEVQW